MKPKKLLEDIPSVDDDAKQKKKKEYDKGRVAPDGYIYTPYITKNGRVIYHPTGGVFKFLPS